MRDNEIRIIVKEAVSETLSGLGFTTSEPHELQADLLHIRRLRTGSEYISRKVRAGVAWGVIVSISSSVLFLLKEWVMPK